MKVVALLSGGKDSCYTILKVRAHGHSVVALAHITPPCDEPDSFMYQSVGSSAIPSLASALQIPLVTTATHARAKNTSLAYSPTDGDEVEDLVSLLQSVKQQFPTVQAVCAGALWSDYQRLRVESAASRVGLLSLAPLWRRDQSDLLDEMIASGVHAILIKVAGVGLNQNHLGKSLLQMRPTLKKLEATYGSHVCGEGGEYESLVLWMPGFKQQLILDEVEIVHHSDDSVAPVSFLRIHRLHLEQLSEEQRDWPAPASADLPTLFQFKPNSPTNCDTSSESKPVSNTPPEYKSDVSSGTNGHFMHITCRSQRSGGDGVHEACQLLEQTLQQHDSSLSQVVTVHLHLSTVSGDSYAAANRGYSKVFGRPDCVPPPGRACVGIGSSHVNAPVTIETLVRLQRIERPVALHVQSLSEWAPPCIGPYAQFVEEDGVFHVSGVLPLYAPKAAVLPGMSLTKQVEICAENMRRTLEAGRGEMDRIGLFVVYVVGCNSDMEVSVAMQKHLQHERSLFMIIPVEGLPKGALVEIRAVGALSGSDLWKPSLSSHLMTQFRQREVEYEAVACGKLGYFALLSRCTSDSALDILSHLRHCIAAVPFQVHATPLALQIYVHGNIATELRELLTEKFAQSGITVFSSSWLPKRSKWIALVTFAL